MPLPDTSLPAEYEIEIVNYFGNVEVRPSDSDRVILDAKKTVRAVNQDEANRLERDFTFSITNDGSKYRITSSKDNGTGRRVGRQGFKSSLSIQLPKRFAVHLDNRNGRVSIQDLTGNEEITNRYGDIEIRNITGKLKLENRNGSVNVEDVSDSVSINNGYSSTTAKNIGGDLRIEAKNGSVDVSGVKGNATITNAYAPINVENVQGELTINGRNNSIDVQHVDGDINADSSYENVTIRDPRSGVRVNSRNGELTVSFEKPPQKDVVISSRYGAVTVDLPSTSIFKIDARTQYGQIDSEFEGLTHNNSSREKSLTGEVGHGGPRISIDLRNGDIHLGKRG
jgi:hypothetical protein